MEGKLYFCVLGEQKCGTTWLFKNLVNHPEVYIPKNKEPSAVLRNRYHLYEGKLNKYKCGDMTPEYLVESKICAKKLYDHNPQCKLIVMLRHPVERAVSQYNMQVNFNFQPYKMMKELSVYDAFMKDYPKDGKSIKKRSLYYKNLKEYLKYFDMKKMFFIFQEDIIENPRKIILDTCHFLEINPTVSIYVDHIIRPIISNRKTSLKKTLTKNEYNNIIMFTKPEIVQLEKLLNRDLSSYYNETI